MTHLGNRTSPHSTDGPLVFIEEPNLADDVLRIAASAGVTAELVPDLVAVRRRWLSARTIILDALAAKQCAQALLPFRDGVILIGRGEPEDAIWELASGISADHVVTLPAAETWLTERLRPTRAAAVNAGKIVTVVGGCGGAGASVLATALALTSSRREASTVLIDADPLGSGLDLTLGRESKDDTGAGWADLMAEANPQGSSNIMDVLPRLGDLCLLLWGRERSGSLTGEAMATALDIVTHESQLTIVDLPRYPDEATLVALARSTRTFFVVPASVPATYAAARLAPFLIEHSPAVECVVRGPSPAGLSPHDISRVLELPLAASLKAEPGLAAALERGEPPGARLRGPLATSCQELLTRLDEPGKGRK
ncbi:MAG: septum site-determining protein minD [Corynebacteriales bacterium]|nr:septum site-determining protein minD [Mycobacteriales bacterium]